MPKFWQLDSKTRVTRLGGIQRSLGLVKGLLLAYDPTTSRGEIEIDAHRLPFLNVMSEVSRKKKNQDLTQFVNQEIALTFWPTCNEPFEPASGSASLALPLLKACWVRVDETMTRNGYVEVIGKLSRIWDGGFELSIRSTMTHQTYWIALAGDYPYPDEIGQYVRVTGTLDPSDHVIHFEEADAIAFVSPKIALDFIKRLKETQQAQQHPHKKDLSA